MIQSENKKYNLKLWWGIVSKIPRLLWLLLKNKRKKTQIEQFNFHEPKNEIRQVNENEMNEDLDELEDEEEVINGNF